MSSYVKENNTLWPTPEGAIDFRNGLPLGTYSVMVCQRRGFYLQEMEDFVISGKLYGNTIQRADRILNTFQNRESCTGVLLTGEKGSGKTLLSKMISQKDASSGISTLVINQPLVGEAFNQFIQSIEEPKIVIFDEFEKVYNEDEQKAILTLLDGVYPSKTLFLLTSNDKYRVNMCMQNRPGRIYYLIDFRGVDSEFITEYCEDNLNSKEHIPTICRLAQLFGSFNFDMLKALVEEMNRYSETPHQALEMLNAKPHLNDADLYDISVHCSGKQLLEKEFYPSSLNSNPLHHQVINMTRYIKDKEDGYEKSIILRPSDLKNLEIEKGIYTYVSDELTITFTKEKAKHLGVLDYLL